MRLGKWWIIFAICAMKGFGARKIQKISCAFYIGRAQIKNFSLSKRKFGGG